MSYSPKVYIRDYGTPTKRLLAFTGNFLVDGKDVSLKRNLRFVAESPSSGLVRLLLAGDAQSGTDVFLLSDSYQFLLTDSHQYGTYFYDVNSFGKFLLKVSGDMQSSDDRMLTSGDMQSGTDKVKISYA